MRMTYRRKFRITAQLLAFSGVLALGACKKGEDASAAETAKNAVLTVGAENVVIASNGSIMSGPQISDRKSVV